MSKQGPTRYQQQLKGGGSSKPRGSSSLKSGSSIEKAQIRENGDAIDEKFGFSRLTEVNVL